MFELAIYSWKRCKRLRGDERKVYRYDRMAMLVEREDMEFF